MNTAVSQTIGSLVVKFAYFRSHELARVRPSRPSCLPLAAVARQARRGARRLSCIQRKSGQAPGPPRYTRTFRQSKLHSATHFVKPATPWRPVPICDFVSQWQTMNCSAADSFITGESIAWLIRDEQMTTRERVAYSSQDGCAHLLHSTPSLGMMQSHAYDAGTNRAEHSDAAFRVHSAIHQHRRLMDSRLADHVLRLRDPLLAIDQRVRNDRAMGILRDARSQGPAEFQNHRNDLWGGDARRQFLLLLQNRPGRLVRFRSRCPAFLSADGIRTTNVCAVAARRAPADDGLHIVRPALRALALQF